MQWQDKLATKILRCPYQHITFTMPHRLNTLAKAYPYNVYNILMRSAWMALKKCTAKDDHLGATPGAIMVLHTFGSDLKYHVHVHCLVTFGGIDKIGNWKWPKRKNKIIPFRALRAVFRSIFIQNLKKTYHQFNLPDPFDVLENDLLKKQWCVNQQPPTTNTQIIQQYLGKYICRVGLSKNRFHYDQTHQIVTLSFKDYKNAEPSTGIAPHSTKTLIPLLAINQILQHALPPYFQKCRYYGIHASATFKKHQSSIPKNIKNNSDTVRTIFQIIHQMLGLDTIKCTRCKHDQFEITFVKPNRKWIIPYLNSTPPQNRGSPYPNIGISRSSLHLRTLPKGHLMPIESKSTQS